MNICSTSKSRCASQFVPKCQNPHPKLSYDFAKFAAFANSGQVKSNLLTPYTHCNICFCFWGHIRCLRALILELHSLSKSLPKRQRSTQISLKYFSSFTLMGLLQSYTSSKSTWCREMSKELECLTISTM